MFSLFWLKFPAETSLRSSRCSLAKYRNGESTFGLDVFVMIDRHLTVGPCVVLYVWCGSVASDFVEAVILTSIWLVHFID